MMRNSHNGLGGLDEMTEMHRLSAGENNRSAILTFPWQTALLLVAIGIVASSAQAQDATWNFAPGSSDYNTPTNWTPTAAPIGPSGTASFGASGTTSLTFSTGTTVDTFQFNPGASAYTFDLNGHFLEFTGSGIVNNSSNAPTINAFGLLQFDNTATAGNAIINNTPGSTTFTGFSTAGTATITNSGGGLLSFTDSSNAGSATITTNAGSRTQFSANSDGGNARFVTNAGGIVDFSSTTGSDDSTIINTGSIAGSGRYFLGSNIVHVGGNGDTTTVSGVISACGIGNECTASGTSGGSLFKDGAGTLTLSGVNTYTGSTVVNGGTLLIAGAGTLGASTAQLQVLAGTLDLGGTTQVTGGLSTFGGSIVNGALNSTAYTLGGGFISASLTGGGAVTQDGVGTTTLAATNTYAGGTIINSGTLEAAHVSGGAIDVLSSGGITINSLGALRSSVNGTLSNNITFSSGSNGTLSAAAGTTLTVTGGIFLIPDSVTTFGTPTDTGTILMNPSGISPGTTASVVVGGGILRAGSNQLGNALGVIQSTTVNAAATLDFADFTAAVRNLQGGGSVMTGALAATTLSLSVDAATTSEFSGVISGAGKVSVSDSGTMILSGSNTYGNGTVIAGASTLQIGNGGTTGSILGDVANGGTLIFNRSDAYTFTGAITGSGDNIGNAVQNGTGTTILTAANTYTGTTTINAGTLQLGNGGTTGSILGGVVDNGTFAINRSNAVAFNGVISGTGAFQQLGAGTTTLTAVQTYQGSTTISAGVLALTGTASIAASSGVAANAKFDISGLSAGTSITTLSGGSAGTVALGNNTLTLTNAAGTFAGVISGNGGLVKQGSGLFTLSGANDYTGATTVAGGDLRVNGSVASAVTVQSGATLSGIGSVGGLVTVQSGGILSAGQSPGTITLGALNLNAGSTSVFELGSAGVVGSATNDLVNVTGNLTLGGTLSVNAPSAGYYRLFNYGTLTPSNFATISGSSNGTATVLTNVPNQVNLSIAAAGQRIQFWDGADQTGNGVVNGGTGTWNATNTNWTGAPGQANINDQWRSSVGVFSGTAGTVTVAGAQGFDTLQFSTTGYVLNPGAGGQLQLAGLSGTGTINTDSGVVATINAPIVNGSSQSLTKVGGGTLVLTAANTYSGGTTISGGTLQLGNGGANGSIIGNVTDNGVLAFNRSDTVTFGGVISGTGQLMQTGTGTTTLTGNNTYTGATTINSGTLALSGAGNIASSSGVIANGAFDISGVAGAGTSIQTLAGAGNVALGAKTLTLTNASGNFAGAIGGSGGVTLAAGTQTLSGVNGYTDATTISGGTLALSGAGNIASSSGVVANGAFDISAVSGAGTSIQTLAGAGSVALDAKTLTLSNASGNFAGSIGGSGGFTLAAGTQTLSGVNGYTGATTISGGTLALSGAGSIASSSGVVANSVFDVSGVAGAGTSIKSLSGSGSVALGTKTLSLTNASGNFAGSIGGTGGFTLAAGTQTLSGVNGYTGATAITGGTLALSGAGSIASSSGVIASGAFDISGVSGAGTSIQTLAGTGSVALGAKTLTLTNASGNFAGSIGGAGGFTLAAGTETLSGTNTYTGGTTISGGTLNIAAGGSITSNVNNTATFNNAGTVTGALFNSGTASNSGTITNGLTNFAGTTTNSGTINGGVSNSGSGTLNTTATSVINGGLINAATMNAQGQINGAIQNNFNGVFNVTGNLSSDSTFRNGSSATLNVNTGTYALAGQLSNFSQVKVLAGATLTAGGINSSGFAASIDNSGTVNGDLSNSNFITNQSTGVWNGNVVTGSLNSFTNNGIWNGNLQNTAAGISGPINNNGTWNGTVSNAGTFNNSAAATVSGLFTNTGTLTTTGALQGGLINSGTVNAAGVINGAIANNAGTFNVTGTLTGNSSFTNAASATLAIGGAGAYTLQGLLTNSGAITVASGGQLIATVGGITNNAGGTITVALGGTVKDDLNNAGAVTNGGAYFANVATNSGAITNNSVWTGNVVSNTGTINNNLTWTGTIANAGTFNNNAGATVSGLLTNTAGSTTNNGALNGGATVSGGTLNTNTASSIVNGGLTNSAAVNAQGQVNGAILNQGAGAFNVAGNLTGNNSFTNNGTAQLLVTGGNFFGVTTLVNNSTNATGINVAATRTLSTTGTVTNATGANIAVNGTLTAGQLLTNAGVILVNSGGTLNATVGGITNSATGTITVALGGIVNDDLNNVGAIMNNGAYNAIVATNTGAITNGATGAWTGNVLSNAAVITNNGVWTGNVASNTGTIDNNKTWTGTIANAGTFNNNAGATVSGLLTNTAGTTMNDGALNGGATVSGGTFAGSGAVTNLTISGGTFAPGNGTPGTFMTVTGNLAFQSGALYLVQLNPTTASFASVGGTASLNGTAAAVYLAGNYVSKKYTILTATGGVTGTFGSLVNTNVPANFTSSLSYDANNAYINLVLNFVPNPAPNFGSGLNVNQQNVANTLVNFFNTTGGIPLVFGALTPAGLTQASGELGTGVIQSSIKANDMFLNLLLDPSVAGRARGFASGSAASQFAADDEALAYGAKRKASPGEREAYAMATKASYLAPQPVSRWSVWGAAYGGSATTDGNAVVGSHDTTARAYGVVGGADYKISPDTLIGFALAGGGTSFSIADALGTGRSDLFQAGVFGRQNIGAAYLSAALAYGWQDVTTNRTVALPGGDVLQARFKAETFSGRFEGGYRFATPLAGITPYVAAQLISFNLPAYAEQVLGGLGTFALNYGAQTTTATRTELGLRTDKSFALQDGIFTLRGRAAWAHDYNSDRAVTAVFQTLPGAAFVVNGARANPDGALVSAGAEMKWLNGISLAATFEGEFSGNTTSYAGKGVAKYTW
jgi:fibronectin-binding autotransporter adhesin